MGRDFFLVWIGQTISIFGDTVGAMALSIYILQTTGSATAASFNMFLSTVPRLIVGPIAGVVLDRASRKKIMVTCDTVQGVTTTALAFLLLTRSLSIVHIYLWTLVQSVVRMFYEPSTYALIPSVVERGSLQQANAMQSTGRSMGQVLGPAAGGILVAFWGPQIAMFTDAVTFFISAVCISLARARQDQMAPVRSRRGLRTGLADFMEGLRFFSHEKLALYLLIMTMVINMAMMPSGLSLQYHLINTLKSSPEVYGLTWSFSSAATLFSSLILVSRKRWKRQSLMLAVGTLGMGVPMLLATCVKNPNVIPAIWTIYGLSSPVLGVAVSTLYQEITPTELRGRVFSVRAMLATALTPISTLVIGPILDSVGSILTLVGLGTLLTFTALWVYATREFRLRDELVLQNHPS